MKLEKLIILTEYFPPNNCAASNRVFSWAINLIKYGYYPVIFCKNDLNDEQCFIERQELYEVHYIKCAEPTLQKRRIYSKNAYVRKAFGMLHYFFVNSIKYNGIKSIEEYASDYIQEHGIKKMVATAPTYSIFGLASLLAKKYNVKWIADYRDDWTTSELSFITFFQLFQRIDRFKEKKYLKNATCFTSVSNYYIQKIASVINKEGFLVENGFNLNEVEYIESSSSNDKLLILYPGSLYSTQKLDIIGDALGILPDHIIKKLEIVFVGSEISGVNLPANCVRFLNKTLFFFKRISRSELKTFLQKADVFLALTHSDENNNQIKGIPSSKLYDYISSRKKILVCPSDHDIVQEKLSETKQGVFCNTGKELAESICALYQMKIENQFIPLVDIADDIYYKNTREFQAGKLAAVLRML